MVAGGNGRALYLQRFGISDTGPQPQHLLAAVYAHLGLYLLAVGFIRRLDWRQMIGRLVLLFGFGLGMTFFYSGGALLEMDQVTLQQSTIHAQQRFSLQFCQPWARFSARLPAEDPALINPPLVIPIRLDSASALAALGLVSLFWRKKRLEIGDQRLKNLFLQSLISSLQSLKENNAGISF